MDPRYAFYGTSHKGSPYARQQQHPTQPQGAPAQIQHEASYRPNVPRGNEMPDEWGYNILRTAQVSDVPSYVQGGSHQTGFPPYGVPQPFPSAAPSAPTCRYLNCHRPVTRDMVTHELSEYCTKEHMQEDLRRGAPACPACGRCPRRINNNYCGSSCERWAMEKQRSRQQHYTPMTPQTPVPAPGSFNWGSMAGGLPADGNPAAGYQPYYGPPNPPTGGLVRCPRCSATCQSGRACPRCGHRLSPLILR